MDQDTLNEDDVGRSSSGGDLKKSEDSHIYPRRWLSTLAVLIVILLLLNIFNFILLKEDGDRVEYPSDQVPEGLEPEPIVINTDDTWTGREEILRRPIIVRAGATLSLVECNLTVDLLELVLGNQSWITVDEGGSLKMDNTRLAIVYDHRLEGAVIAGGYEGTTQPWSVSRAVNLRGTEEPVLSFELFWWKGNGTVTVAAQPGPGDDLEEVTVIEPDEGRTREWIEYELSLANHSGEVVRLVIFTNTSGYMDVFIGKTWVLDEASDLPYDSFETGRVWEDGWLCRGFSPLFMSMTWELQNWRPLITAHGDVELQSSIIEAPPGLPRGDQRYSSSKYQPAPLEEAVGSTSLNWAKTTRGGHINVQGSRISLEASSIVNVPVVVFESQISIRGSNLTGDADLLAINESGGTIEGTILTCLSFEELQPKSSGYYPGDRGVAIGIGYNISLGPIAIHDCRFVGARIALDLNHAWVELDGCEFINFSEKAIWAHDTRGLGAWGEINELNTFSDSEGARFFESHTAIIELLGPGRPPEGWVYARNTGFVDWEGLEDGPLQSIIHVDAYRAYILMPTFIVDSSGYGLTVDEVVIDVWTQWGGAEAIVLDSSIREGTIELD